MPSILEALLLGFIQGATEFLPISSSGHLVLIPAILGIQEPDLTLVTIAHLGSLLAVLIYFRHDLARIIIGVLNGLKERKPTGNVDARTGWLILFGSIPAGIAGLALNSFFEQMFANPQAAAFFLLITAGLLVFGEHKLTGRKTVADISWWDALIIGLFQMFALFPGISRSGSTISGALWRGLDRTTAARFSFLLGIPAILGAGLLAGVDLLGRGVDSSQMLVYLTTFVAAAVTAYLCIYLLLAWLRQHTLYPFALYCAVLGSTFLLLSFLDVF